MKPTISIIAAISTNKVIGRDNKLPWHIPEDLKRFKDLTKGHTIIMGRKTYESIGRPLPLRTNIIITRDQTYTIDGCVIVHSLDEAIRKAQEIDTDEIFIIGGGEIFRQAIQTTDKLYLTIVETLIEGDAFFPDFEQDFTNETFRQEGESNGYAFTFRDLKRTF